MREEATLGFINEQYFDFDTPKPIFYANTKTDLILFLTKLLGCALAEAWPSSDDNWRSIYVQCIVKICETLARIESDNACGVGGKYISEQFLSKANTKDCRPESMKTVCDEVGMAISTCVLYHADLGTTNIIFELESDTGRVGIIDWACVGFFPRAWVSEV